MSHSVSSVCMKSADRYLFLFIDVFHDDSVMSFVGHEYALPSRKRAHDDYDEDEHEDDNDRMNPREGDRDALTPSPSEY